MAKFYLGKTQVKNCENLGDTVKVKAINKKGEEEFFEADYCLVAVGRTPFTKGLGLENVGVAVDKRGMVVTNDHLQTNIPNIYAIGDVVKGAMLAHKAEEEGVACVEIINGQKTHIC